MHLVTLSHTLTLSVAPIYEGSTRRRGLYRHRTQHSRILTYMPQAAFEPATPTSGLGQSYALDCAAAGIGWNKFCCHKLTCPLMVSFIGCNFLRSKLACRWCDCVSGDSVSTACEQRNSVNFKHVCYPCNISRTFFKAKQAHARSMRRTGAEGNGQQTAGTQLL